ncbi:MAG TPA: heavy metal-responsive transcriptional regulator [Pseudonocardiaceae bacterium]|jgi:DNA-binding transcriptional MerR regulator
MSAEDYLRIGEVAARARVNVQTLRYYERIGLLPEPRRLSSGYRAYPPGAVHTVRFVKRAQRLGFTLVEIRTLLRLAGSEERCAQTHALMERRIARLEAEITELQAMRDELRRLATGCDTPHPDTACPVTDAIEHSAG